MFSIVVVKRALIFFFFSSPNQMLILFSATVRRSKTGRRGLGGCGEACDANMSTQHKKKVSVKTFAAVYENAKVNTSCPRYDHTRGCTLTHIAGMLQVHTQGRRRRRRRFRGAKGKHTQAVFKDLSCGELMVSK